MKLSIVAIAAATLFAAAPASATEILFTNGTNPTSWSKDDIKVTVTGWSTASTARTSTPTPGTATAYAGLGYGVRNAASDDKHTIDNSGSFDFLRLEFNKAVTLTAVTLAQFGDTDAWISFGNQATNMQSTAGWGSFLDHGTDYLGGNANRTFSVNKNESATVWLIGAARNAGTDDSFKVSSINVTGAVPEPATWALMLVGFGGVGFAMRRRKTKVTTTVAFA